MHVRARAYVQLIIKNAGERERETRGIVFRIYFTVRSVTVTINEWLQHNDDKEDETVESKAEKKQASVETIHVMWFVQKKNAIKMVTITL